MNQPGRAPADGSPRGRRGFVSTSSAGQWDDGILVGSGRVGAALWGDTATHLVTISHEHFFLPVHERPLPPDLAQARRAARTALLHGDAAGAARTIDRAAGTDALVWTDPLAPCGTVGIRIDGGDRAITGYRRELDFEQGRASVHWRAESGAVRIEVRAPRGGECVLIEVHAWPGARVAAEFAVPEAPSAVGLECRSHGPSSAALSIAAPGVAPATARTATITLSTDELDVSVRPGAPSITAMGVVPSEGRLVLRLDLAVSGIGRRPTSATDIGEHTILQQASWLDLGADAGRSLPTEDLFSGAADDAGHRRALIELAYAAGRYTVISATGDLPATLQGVWQGTWTPAWSSDYTMNGNVQNGGIASLVPTGTPGLLRALTGLLTAHASDFRLNARRLFGFDGAMLPSRMSTHGLANHFSHDYPHQFWTGAGGWSLRMLADAVLATGDATLVDDDVWRLAIEIMRFYRELVAEGPIAPGYSPENTPRGRETPLSVQPTMDVAILRDAPRSFAVICEARGETAPDVAVFVPPAAGYRIGPDGVLAEWMSAEFEDRVEHRHSSQLYPLWYETDPALDETLLAAAHRLVHTKIAWRAADDRPPPGHMEMAFGLAQIGLAAAALGDGEAALRCVHWLAMAHFTAAMTTTHDAGRIFNVDASGALPALVASMLVRSTRSVISLLPALPGEWPSGAVGGLTTRTGLRLREMAWRDDGVTAVLEGGPESRWVRRAGVRVELPRDARLRIGDGWSPPSRTFDLGVIDERALEFRWAAADPVGMEGSATRSPKRRQPPVADRSAPA